MKSNTKNLLIGAIIGCVGGATGLHLSYTMDGAKIHWFLLPMSIVAGAFLYTREVDR